MNFALKSVKYFAVAGQKSL